MDIIEKSLRTLLQRLRAAQVRMMESHLRKLASAAHNQVDSLCKQADSARERARQLTAKRDADVDAAFEEYRAKVEAIVTAFNKASTALCVEQENLRVAVQRSTRIETALAELIGEA